MKIIMSLIILVSCMFSIDVKIDKDYVERNYNALSDSQKEVMRMAFKLGEVLIINDESFGYTIATFTFIESSSGRIKKGDNGLSSGLTHFTIERAREVLETSLYFQGLNKLSDSELRKKLTDNDQLNILLCILNFRLNYAKWNNVYSKAIRAHNGYNPNAGFHNVDYYERFINAMQIVKKVINENL